MSGKGVGRWNKGKKYNWHAQCVWGDGWDGMGGVQVGGRKEAIRSSMRVFSSEWGLLAQHPMTKTPHSRHMERWNRWNRRGIVIDPPNGDVICTNSSCGRRPKTMRKKTRAFRDPCASVCAFIGGVDGERVGMDGERIEDEDEGEGGSGQSGQSGVGLG